MEITFSSINIDQENPIITFGNVCPAIKFANNRTPIFPTLGSCEGSIGD